MPGPFLRFCDSELCAEVDLGGLSPPRGRTPPLMWQEEEARGSLSPLGVALTPAWPSPPPVTSCPEDAPAHARPSPRSFPHKWRGMRLEEGLRGGRTQGGAPPGQTLQGLASHTEPATLHPWRVHARTRARVRMHTRAGTACAAPWVPVAHPRPPRGVGAAILSPPAAAVHTGRPQSLPHSGKPTPAAGWRWERGSVGGRRRSEADGGMYTERSPRAGWGSARRHIPTHPALPSGCCGPGDKPHLGPSSQGRSGEQQGSVVMVLPPRLWALQGPPHPASVPSGLCSSRCFFPIGPEYSQNGPS